MVCAGRLGHVLAQHPVDFGLVFPAFGVRLEPCDNIRIETDGNRRFQGLEVSTYKTESERIAG
jgi:hypothetical protein